MRQAANKYWRDYEEALSWGLAEVASELRLIDAVNLVADVHGGRFANIESLVQSSTERFFKKGTIVFASSGDVDLKWDGPPSIVLAMEFHHLKVDIHFRIMLRARQAAVEIDFISFGTGEPDCPAGARSLISAIADARLIPLPEHCLSRQSRDITRPSADR